MEHIAAVFHHASLPRRTARLIAWVALLLGIVVTDVVPGRAQTPSVSIQMEVESTTVASGAQPAIKLIVTNLTPTTLTVTPYPFLTVQATTGESYYPMVFRFAPSYVAIFPPSQPVYAWGTASLFRPLDRFREFYVPGQYTISYCVRLQGADTCSNSIAITLQ